LNEEELDFSEELSSRDLPDECDLFRTMYTDYGRNGSPVRAMCGVNDARTTFDTTTTVVRSEDIIT